MHIRLWDIWDYQWCQDMQDFFSETIIHKHTFKKLIENQELFIAEIWPKIVWLVSYKPLWNKSAFLQLLRVHPNFHRKGIWCKLVQSLEERLQKNWVSQIFSTLSPNNTASRKLHEKLDYSESGHIDFPSGKEIVYIKIL